MVLISADGRGEVAVSRPASREAVATATADPEIVTRMSSSSGRHWAVNLGSFPTEFDAQKTLVRTALAENRALGDGVRKVLRRSGGFEARVAGLTREQADRACHRLQARSQTCFAVSP